ncbi:MAG: tetratricopeptide repeat protein [Arenicellales bacterium]|nr:tetratricopeptide repeat protein [Arenicellales bacterium]
MNTPATDPLSDLPDGLAGYANELAAAQKRLQAPASDLAILLDLILKRSVTRDQICDLLQKAWSHLQALREALDDLCQTNPKDITLSEALTEASAVARSGGQFSLAKVDHFLSEAGGHLSDAANAKTVQAMLAEARALLSYLMQDYQKAADHYAAAATISGDNDALKWCYQSQRALVLCDLGRESLDDNALLAAVDLYQAIAAKLTDEARDPERWAKTQADLGHALGILGQRRQGTHRLEQSIAKYRRALKAQSIKHSPADWAATQNGLGNALGILAHRQKDVEMLEQSLQAFEQALTVRTQAQHPWDWATTQNNLGSVLQALGQQKNDPQLLKRSVETYQRVLLAWTRDQAPLHWATVFNNLGTALRLLGEKRKGPRTLQQAVAAYKNALAERTRERVPQQWAMTQNNLGTALQKLGERSESVQPFKDAISAYQSALKEWTQERSPMTWAMTAANLALAQKSLAERLGDPGTTGLALRQLEAVAKVFREASHAQYYEHATEQIAKTRELLEALRGS